MRVFFTVERADGGRGAFTATERAAIARVQRSGALKAHLKRLWAACGMRLASVRVLGDGTVETTETIETTGAARDLESDLYHYGRSGGFGSPKKVLVVERRDGSRRVVPAAEVATERVQVHRQGDWFWQQVTRVKRRRTWQGLPVHPESEFTLYASTQAATFKRMGRVFK
jgi:hypothetical protein